MKSVGHIAAHVVLQDLLLLVGVLVLLRVPALPTADVVHEDLLEAVHAEKGGWLAETNYQGSNNFNVLVVFVSLCRINICSLYLRMMVIQVWWAIIILPQVGPKIQKHRRVPWVNYMYLSFRTSGVVWIILLA